ncbi:MAG: hypothetical protein ACO1PZ_00820 [Gammaproteobacteria bacterium]
MIFKCEECSHLFEISDPAIGSESRLDITACPACGMPGRKSAEVRLIAALLTIQFISAVSLAAGYFFDNPASLYAAGLLVASFWLLILNNRKGYPIVFRRVKAVAAAK